MGLNAKDLKAFGMQWLRFQKQCYIVCTEAGNFHSDVYGITDNFSIEMEVKISKSDLLHDFKKPKHKIYKSLDKSYIDNIPNYFYYLIPYSLKFDADNMCKGTPYGIILSDTNKLMEGKFSIFKPAKRIHNNKPNEALKKLFMLRMASELANYHLNFEKIIKQIELGFSDTMAHLSNIDKLIFKEESDKLNTKITLKEEPLKVADSLDSLKNFLGE